MLIPSKPKITWSNVISDKPKHKNSEIKSLGIHIPLSFENLSSADIQVHANTPLMTGIIFIEHGQLG